ncbi:hypothetical protein V6N13_005623 [Hibiscus sabdariffa]|uniref:Uncharacterized protein n=1 Tax=Hibiscus sabdariffa TaxID=183260 RepID=A0ABR2EQ57_9ROSI
METRGLVNLSLSTTGETVIAEKHMHPELVDLKKAELLFYKQKVKFDWLNDGHKFDTFDSMAENLIKFFTNQIGTVDNRAHEGSVAELKDILQVSIPSNAHDVLLQVSIPSNAHDVLLQVST